MVPLLRPGTASSSPTQPTSCTCKVPEHTGQHVSCRQKHHQAENTSTSLFPTAVRHSRRRTGERGRLVERAVLVVEVGGAVVRAEGGGGGQDQLLFDDAGFGMVLGQLGQALLQRVSEEVQALGRLAQTGLRLRSGTRSGCNSPRPPRFM